MEIEDYGARRLDGALSYFAAYAYVSISYSLTFSRPGRAIECSIYKIRSVMVEKIKGIWRRNRMSCVVETKG